MKNFGILVLVVLSLTFVGCASSVPRMRAETRADVVGEAIVMEETVTTAADGSVTRTIKTVRKSAPAVDQELKQAELTGRTAVGVAKATPKDPCASWLLAPSYCYQGVGRYSGGSGYYRSGAGGANASYGGRSNRSRSVNNGSGGSNTSGGGGEGVTTRPPTGGGSGGSNTTGRGH